MTTTDKLADLTWEHAANEWADTATNGVQWLKNVRDGISTFDEAIADMERGFAHCRNVQPAALSETEQAPAVGGDVVEPDGYAYRYPDGIRHTNGRDVNGNKPIEAIPYYYGKPLATQGDARDTERLDWLDAQNLKMRMGWGVNQAPAGNVVVQSIVMLGSRGPTPIRAAIDAAIAAQAGGE